MDRVADASLAERAGATRIELNLALELDGLTPTPGMCRAVVQRLRIPTIAMLRPHADGFVYSPVDREVLWQDLLWLRQCGVSGIAFGALTADGTLDIELLRQVRERCGELELVLHRAFDQLVDQHEGLAQAIDCGCQRVLTSGGAPTAWQGAARLRDLAQQAAGRIEILAGGGICSRNASQLLEISSCDQLHGSFRDRRQSPPRLDAEEVGRTRRCLDQRPQF